MPYTELRAKYKPAMESHAFSLRQVCDSVPYESAFTAKEYLECTIVLIMVCCERRRGRPEKRETFLLPMTSCEKWTKKPKKIAGGLRPLHPHQGAPKAAPPGPPGLV